MSNIKKQTKYWTMTSGDKIRICDMTDSHLINCLNLVRRRIIKNFLILTPNLSIEDVKEKLIEYNGDIHKELYLEKERRKLDWSLLDLESDPKILLLFSENSLFSNDDRKASTVSWGFNNKKKKKKESKKVNNKFGLLFIENENDNKNEEKDLEF